MKLYRIGAILAVVFSLFGCAKPAFIAPDISGTWKSVEGDPPKLVLEFDPNGKLTRRALVLRDGARPVEIVTWADYKLTEKTIRLTNIREGSPGPEGTVSGELRVSYKVEGAKMWLYPDTEREVELEKAG